MIQDHKTFISRCGGIATAVAAAFLLAFAVAGQSVESYSAALSSGTAEQKRDALHDLRNMRSAEASRAAAVVLRDADEQVRATAAAAVVFLPPAQAFEALAPNLTDKSEMVRRETALAIGELRYPPAVSTLASAYDKEKSPAVRAAIVVALGGTVDASALPLLDSVLGRKPKDDKEFTRRSAARAIGEIALAVQASAFTTTPESFLPEKLKSCRDCRFRDLTEQPAFGGVVSTLIKALGNAKESPDTRREAAFALGAMAAKSAKPALETAAKSDDYYLAEIARESLIRLGN